MAAAASWADALPDDGYLPPRRERLTLTLDAFRPPPFEDLPPRKQGEPDPRDERAKDVMHLARRLSKMTRRPGTQGWLTGQREKCLRALLGFAKTGAVCRPTYKDFMAAGPFCCDVVRETLHFGEVTNVLRVINHVAPGQARRGPNSYVVLPVPSRFCPVACQEWLDAKVAAIRELQAAQDRAIVRVAVGLFGLRWLAAWRQRAFSSWVDSYEDRVRQRARAEGRDPEQAVLANRERVRVPPLSPSHAGTLRAATVAHVPPKRYCTEPPALRIARLPPPSEAPQTSRTVGGRHTGFRSEIKIYDSNHNCTGGAEGPRFRRPHADPQVLRRWALDFIERSKKRGKPP